MADEEPTSGSDSPCRLFVYLAVAAPIGVVLRRGPSDWARLSVWHTDSDTFDHGQWIKGRVYERRSDVSADGSLFVAFVRQSGGRIAKPPASDTWVAISRPPYFSALAVWFVGGTYHTGGFFPAPSSLWVGFHEQPPDIGELPAWLTIAPPRSIPYIDRTSNWTDRTVHYNRLLRDGWQRQEDDKWVRAAPVVPLQLAMSERFEDFRRYGGPYLVRYSVFEAGSRETELGEATWADWDQQGRLVVAREGRLLAWDQSSGLREILDFNGQAPDPRPAPEWAKTWPERTG